MNIPSGPRNKKIEFLRTDKTYLIGLILFMIAPLLDSGEVGPGNMVIALFLGLLSGIGLIFMVTGFVCRIARTMNDTDFRSSKKQIVVTVLESLVPLYMIVMSVFPLCMIVYMRVMA